MWVRVPPRAPPTNSSSNPDGVRPCVQRRIEGVEDGPRRAAIVRATRRADAPHHGARVVQREAERLERLLALDGVLDDVRCEAVKPEAHVDAVRDLVRPPLRRPHHLIGIETRERRIRLGTPCGERGQDVEGAAARVRRVRLRPQLGGQRERLLVPPDERVPRVRAIRALHADRVRERLAQTPLARGGRAIEQLVIDGRQQAAQPAERDLGENQDPR